MIIFKAKYERAWDINGFKILCGKDVEDWDYEVTGKYDDNLALLRICLRTIFSNPDKMYKLKFGDALVTPSNYDENVCGFIDADNLKVEKLATYNNNKIVSFCLYGNKDLYFKGALRNIEQYTEQYPDVKCYFYVRKEDVSEENIKQLKEAGGVVIECVDVMDWFMMFTRFLPFENENNKFFLSRDTDCRLNHREIRAIEQWEESGKNVHVMRDHPWHNTLILGGMWGARNTNLEKMRILIMQWCLFYLNKNEQKSKGPDQYFLNALYNVVKKDIFAQDEFFTYEELSEIIDAPRRNKEYIGEAFDENDQVLDMDLRDVIED